ncbi:neurogenic differentiation factor 1, partial [Striga asiatica]
MLQFSCNNVFVRFRRIFHFFLLQDTLDSLWALDVTDGINTKILSDPWVPGLVSGIPSLCAGLSSPCPTWVTIGVVLHLVRFIKPSLSSDCKSFILLYEYLDRSKK